MNNPAPFPFLIKVCGIACEQDAEVAIQAGVHALGLNFYDRSPRYLSMAAAQRISAIVPQGILRVGVFVNPLEQDVVDFARRVPLDVVQLHGPRIPTRFSWPCPTWRAVRVNRSARRDCLADAYLLDSDTPLHGGSGETFDWKLAAGFGEKVILAGGLDSSNVGMAIETAKPWGVDACSRLESSPGRKDPQRIREFVEAAATAFAALSPQAL
ncbi:MAG: phosphoribosylanthranilate isomerase [Acidobacteriaceae bacterium]|nr:phosphoribosylanthranilate isomerase [Acidobacteriaceae bacterium]